MENSHSNSSNGEHRVGRYAIGVSNNQSVHSGQGQEQDLFDESDSESFS